MVYLVATAVVVVIVLLLIALGKLAKLEKAANKLEEWEISATPVDVNERKV